MNRPVVVAGATGFVGRNLVPALVAAGRHVRAGTRTAGSAGAASPGVERVRLDVNDVASLDASLEGADALVYLVHQMRSHGPDLLATERASAERVRAAAERAGLRRIVYLGGPEPAGPPSDHLAARLETGRELRAGTVSCIELQAGMIIGVGSESWLIVRDLAMRLPVMVLPRWLSRRSEPIGIDDVVAALVRSVDLPGTQSRRLSLPGPEAVSARELLVRVAAARGGRPALLPVPVITPRLSSHWIRLVTRADYGVARQLVDGLTCDLVAEGPGFWSEAPDLVRTPLDEAIRRTLSREPPLDAWARRWERLAAALSMSP